MRLLIVVLGLLGLVLSAGCATVRIHDPHARVASLAERVARAEHRSRLAMERERSCRPRAVAASPNDPESFAMCEMPGFVGEALPWLGQDAPGGARHAEPGPQRGPLPGFWETVKRDLRRMPRSLWDDTKAVYTDPGNLVILGAAGAASLSVRVAGVDGKMDDSHGRHDTFQDEWSDAIGALGNPGTHFAMAGLWYLVGQQTQDEKTYEVGRTLFNALAINGVSTMLLKVAANTDSPNGEQLAWPSGHTSSSFTVAEVLRVSYGPWVGVPSYALASLAAFGRIDDREHDFSDLIFGAALGIVVGHTVAEGHAPEIFGGEITPYVSPNSGVAGIAWVKSF